MVVERDGGRGGIAIGWAAPWFPGLTERTDNIRTADNVVQFVHDVVFERWSDVAGIGSARPTVVAAGDALSIRFFGTDGGPLPTVGVALLGRRG